MRKRPSSVQSPSRKNHLLVVWSLREKPPSKLARRITKEAVARNLPVVRRRHLVRDLNDRSSPPSRLWRIFHSPYHPAAVVLPPSLPGSRLFRPELRFERLSSPATLRHPLPLPSTSFRPFNLLSVLSTAIENRRKNLSTVSNLLRTSLRLYETFPPSTLEKRIPVYFNYFPRISILFSSLDPTNTRFRFDLTS